jgi:membrane-bound acyltransferase YfiQ involved in biofilm formation
MFHNYETTRLFIPNVTYNNIFIILIFLVLGLLSVKKSSTVFLDRIQTNQLKGFAIIMVVLGHLWVHVSQKQALPVYGSYSVALFLYLSGFGLTRSAYKRKLSLKDFCIRRISRVMIPYWIVTLLILFFDYVLLDKLYSAKETILTLSGLNLDRAIRDIDYSRWYITSLLVSYILFFVTNKGEFNFEVQHPMIY